MNRTLTVLTVPANDPDAIDAMSFDERRWKGRGWTRIEILHPGEPYALVSAALDLDMGVHRSTPELDHRDERCTVETRLIAGGGLEDAAGLLTPHLDAPVALAKRLIEHARTHEDPEHVARVLVEASSVPAVGPAEEAAAFIRIFMEHVGTALPSQMGIAWELRTYERERPIVSIRDVVEILPLGWEEIADRDPSSDPSDVKWLRHDADVIRLVRNPDSVTITLSEGIVVQEIEVVTLLALRTIVPWLEQACALAAVFRVAVPKTSEQREAEQQDLVAPDVAQVMAVLREGEPIQVGGGRSFPTYAWRQGGLVVIQSDDGYCEERPCSEEMLRAAILDAPNVFNAAIRRHAGS